MSDTAAPTQTFSDILTGAYQEHYKALKGRATKMVISRAIPFHTFLLLISEGIALKVTDDGAIPMISIEPLLKPGAP